MEICICILVFSFIFVLEETRDLAQVFLHHVEKIIRFQNDLLSLNTFLEKMINL